MEGMEVITTTDKAQRDQLFEDLRRNGNKLERQVVKFSGVETVLDIDGQPVVRVLPNYQPGRSGFYNRPRMEVVRHMIDEQNWKVIRVHSRLRPVFRSTWSVAYPKSPLVAARRHRNEEKN